MLDVCMRGARRRHFVPTVLFALASVCCAGVPARADLQQRQAALQQELPALYDGKPVTLAEAIRVALVGASAIGIADENIEVAHKQVLASKAAWLPDLRLSADWTRNERTDYDQQLFDELTGNVIGTEDVTVTQTFKSATLQSNFVVFDGFSRLAGMKVAHATVAGSQASLEEQNELLVQNVSLAYFNLMRAKRQVDVALESEDLAKKELERSQTYFDLGIATKSDVLQARVRYEQTRLDSVRARNAQAQAFVDLTHLMNIPSSQPFEIEDPQLDLNTVEPPGLQQLLEQARSTRTDLEVARHNVDASAARVTQANSGNYPSLTIFGQASRSSSETPYRFGAQSNQSLAWGLSGNWNLFDRFQTKLSKQQAVAERRRNEYMLRQAELDAEKEIVQLHNSLVEAKEQYAVASGTIEQAQEDLRLANERFRVGAGTSLDVINAQVNLTRARTDAINALTAFLIARAQIARATGAPSS